MIDAKEVQAIMKLCRKFGVQAFTTPELSMKFGEMPAKGSAPDDGEPESPDGMSDEEAAFYSVRGPS